MKEQTSRCFSRFDDSTQQLLLAISGLMGTGCWSDNELWLIHCGQIYAVISSISLALTPTQEPWNQREHVSQPMYNLVITYTCIWICNTQTRGWHYRWQGMKRRKYADQLLDMTKGQLREGDYWIAMSEKVGTERLIHKGTPDGRKTFKVAILKLTRVRIGSQWSRSMRYRVFSLHT